MVISACAWSRLCGACRPRSTSPHKATTPAAVQRLSMFPLVFNLIHFLIIFSKSIFSQIFWLVFFLVTGVLQGARCQGECYPCSRESSQGRTHLTSPSCMSCSNTPPHSPLRHSSGSSSRSNLFKPTTTTFCGWPTAPSLLA